MISKNVPLPDHIQRAVLSPLMSLSTDETNAAVPINNNNGIMPPTPQQQLQSHPQPEPMTNSSASASPSAIPNSNNNSTPSISSVAGATVAQQQSASPQQKQFQQFQQQSQQQQQTIPTKPKYNAYASPYNMMKKPISSYAHASRQHRQLIPSITPTGIDNHQLAYEREQKIHQQIEFRMNQLEKVSSSMMEKLSLSLPPSSSTTTTKDEKKRTPLKALIELKGLRLLNKQKQV